MVLELDVEYIIIIVLVTLLFVLLLLFVAATCWFMKRRKLLCFRRRDEASRPILIYDKEVEARVRKVIKLKGRRKRKSKNGANTAIYDRAPKPFKKDPFVAAEFLENPMVNNDEFDMDWSNPAFDVEQARLYDAAVKIQSWYRMIRVRIPFLERRSSAILIQSLYRAYVVRKMVPQWKKEKHLKEQQKRKQAGWRKKGTLAALKFYDVKGYGFAEVEQLYGLDTVRDAADQLKKLYGGKGKMRLKLFISVLGIKLFDYYTMAHFATVKVSSVSFCTLDPKNKKILAFINRKKRRNFCHVFQCHEGDAQKMVETMAEAFEVTFKKMEHEQETARTKRAERAVKMKKTAFHHKSQELDAEVASMMEMAEKASIHTPLNRSGQMLHVAETYSEMSSHGSNSPSLSGSREVLLPVRSRLSTGGESNLLASTAAPPTDSNGRQKAGEAFNPNEVDTHFKKGVDSMVEKVESDSRRASRVTQGAPKASSDQ